MHPPRSRVAKATPGLQIQAGRLMFPLDDGRLGELHQPGAGGNGVGPTPPVNTRRRTATKYTWSILDVPETEGWNAEYCTEERGPSNCIEGVKDEFDNGETSRRASGRRVGNKAQEHYHLEPPDTSESYVVPENFVSSNFRLRLMHEGRCFFLVTEGGMVFEYLNAENVWFWVRHESPTAMKGALGNYNGSLFLVDENNDLIMRERTEKELGWINCTAMKKGRHVIGGPPWDLAPRVTPKDSIFFIGETGNLLRLTVALRKFKWKDCRNPSNTRISCIVDQEVFRENIVFVVGKNGRLYQYNKVTGLWHGYNQSKHMVLSRQPGTAMRPSPQLLSGSLFMLSEDGRLIEFHWNPVEGWDWVEHGTPWLGVTLVGSTGPSFGGNQLFLIGSDGKVYLRYLDQTTWKWDDCGFPDIRKDVCVDPEISQNMHQECENETQNCDPKVAPTRPIPFMEDSVIFELRDGRLGEMRRTGDLQWMWWRTIGTPTSRSNLNYWTDVAS